MTTAAHRRALTRLLRAASHRLTVAILGRVESEAHLVVWGSSMRRSLVLVEVVLSAVALAAVALAGAILGGLTGMRYHRRVDRADLRAT